MRLPAFTAALFVATALHAQTVSTSPCAQAKEKSWGGQPHACELRSVTLPLLNGGVRVRGDNGGINVIGEDRQDVLLETEVTARSPSQASANSLLREITIVTTDSIQARGPGTITSQPSWYVNFTLHVPRHSNADLSTHNGGITLNQVEGKLTAETHNGGINASNLGGDVHLLTVNGGVDVGLAGTRWVGAALFARTTNGGISVQAPAGYSAHLMTQTEHGGTAIGFPITLQGALGKRVNTSLGKGGATIEFVTVNGGVSINKS